MQGLKQKQIFCKNPKRAAKAAGVSVEALKANAEYN